MSQDEFKQFGFDHYDEAKEQKPGFLEYVFGSDMAEKMKRPVFATTGLLVMGVAVAAIIVSVSPEQNDDAPVPVVKAESFAYKEAPSEAGGMDISNMQSTVYEAMDDSEKPSTEALDEPQPQAKIDDFVRQVEEIASSEDAKKQQTQASAKVENLLKKPEAPKSMPKADSVEEVAVAQIKPSRVEPPALAIKHQPGSNPETLEFVRSVLNKEDGATSKKSEQIASAKEVSESAAKAAASVSPAAGSQMAAPIEPGEYYVQLGSVSSSEAAAKGWSAFVKEFPSQLSSLSHRVSTADLGARGTYYRIQAGPMNKASADALCGEIKQQKPAGCLVTK